MLDKTAALGARVAVTNGGGIRASIAKGDIAMGQILEVLPFGNEVTVVTITGRGLVSALENGVSQLESEAGRFPQVAGVRFAFAPTAPTGSRVQRVELWDSETESFRALDPRETVVVATNDFLAGGGDGYEAFAEGEHYDTGWLLSDLLAEYVARISPVKADLAGRIARVAAP